GVRMKPSFRFRLAAVTATSLMVLVAACGSSSSSSSKANTTTTAAASGSTAATPSTAASSTTPTTAPIIGDITFSGVTPNAGNWALQVGVDEGIFRQYGINGKIIYSQSSPASLAALFGGSVQFTTALYDAAIPAWQKNNDLIYVASGYDIL